RIALRAGSVVLPLHHPLRVAEEWAVVDNLSGGRVGLSYASGWHPNDFTLSPENYGRHRELMFERIEIVNRLWRGEAVRFQDGAGQDVDLRIYPLPARRDLPAWITIVNNPDTYRRAGEMGAGVLTNLMGQTPETLAEMLAIYRDALRRGGHPPEAGHVTLLLHTFVLDDAEKAVEIARRPFYEYLKSSVGLLKNMIASEKLELDFDRLSDEDMEYILELAYGRYVRTSALIGSPETVAPIVERLREVGVDEIACLVDFGVDRETVVESLPWLDALKDRTRFREGPRGRHHGGAGVVAAVGEPVPAAPGARPVARFPLTELQGDLYVLSQMGEDSSRAYNEFSVLHLEGPLEVPLLHRAFQLVVDRHEALRTVFPSGEGQEVLAALDMPLPVVDGSALPPERRAEVREALLDAEARRPFDFVHGPMFRLSLARMGERSHVLSICFHHIAADGLSVVLVGREVLVAYEALRGGVRPALAPPYQYRQYAEWLQRPERAASLAADEAYWRQVLTPPLPVFDPPTDRPRPPFQTYEGHRLRAVVPADSWQPLRPFARRQGATSYVALLALYTALLHRWTGQEDHIVSAPANRRPLEGGDSLVGHCIDIVPLRTRFDGGDGSPGYLAWLKTVRTAVFDAQEHADYPFARLIRLARALDPARDPGRPPLIEVV
ncbi:MAG TPA: MupA/Atu3671 family FMN-dependent luciferase-like monooxygenase, partial [Thermoanaerobaculia bacterium]|nr:MupA/Atu3671 family FMN-dependent luciferase-like monooxygenase [Thermoanaerobaculia bacterium]